MKNSKKETPKILACGPTSLNGITGLALAFDLFIDALQKENIDYIVVDSSSRRSGITAGSFSLGRVLESLLIVLRVSIHLKKTGYFYCTMSTSLGGFLREWVCVRLARLFGNQIYLHLHGGGFGIFYHNQGLFFQRMILHHLNRVDGVIVLGEKLKEQFLKAGVSETLLKVVPNGLPTGLKSHRVEAKSIEEAATINILYLSNLMESKGVFDVIECVKILETEFPGRFRLRICGDFVLTKQDEDQQIRNVQGLLDLLHQMGLETAVEYLGTVKGEAKEAVLEQAHIFALPTYYEWEGQPISIIEAQAYGIPSVVTKHRGIPEQVIEGKTGKFVPPRDPKAISKAIREIAEDADLYHRMSILCIENFKKNFTREAHQKKLLSVLFNDSGLNNNER